MDIINLSLEEKVAGMFVVSFDSPILSEEDKQHFIENHFGNFIYFAKNMTDYKSNKKLSYDLQQVAKSSCGIPAIICVDQEGGMVARIFSGATHFPSNMAITASGLTDKMYIIGEMVGKELRGLGINSNLAPDIDINNNPLNPVIGVRSFSDDPYVVAKMGVDYIKGLQKSKVIPTAKHFPGHGDTSVDSHLGLPTVNHKLKHLDDVELVPFKAAIEAGVDSIMSAHIIFKAIDQEGLPATLSHKILTEFLRNKLGFKGLIYTDSMSMEAINTYYGMEKGCVMAVAAGADLICLCGDRKSQKSCYNAVLEAVKSGEIPMETVDNAIERIISYKKKYEINFDEEIDIQECYPSHEALADEISQKSITLIRDKDSLLPLKNKNIFVISPPPITANIADDTLVKQEAFAKSLGEKIGCEYYIIDVNPNEESINYVLSKAEKYDIIVFATYNAILNQGQIKLYEELEKTKNQIINISLRLPFDIMQMPKIQTALAAYEYTNRSVQNILKVLLGELTAVGKMPVNIDVVK